MTTLIGGFVVWGAIGWLLDRWWGTSFLTPVGLILGMALGIYAVVARHGGFRSTHPTTSRPTQYNPGLYRSARYTPDPQPGPPPANTRRETECP
ncbi:hypothetical protein ABIB25_000413 [Nakamurella sp. UYEF19]|uniref:AtpZ/AtpI family protein n=1 Tax=Nakamurella sp. UYEF19 TaxID=1756392 RepID=UPI0033947D27